MKQTNLEPLFTTLTEVQKTFPEVIIAGSLSLILQGYELDREVGDLDLLLPTTDNSVSHLYIRELLLQHPDSDHRSMDHFQGGKILGVNVDIRPVPISHPFNILRRTDINLLFKVNRIEEVLKYKIRYSTGVMGIKHLEDILFLVTSNKKSILQRINELEL